MTTRAMLLTKWGDGDIMGDANRRELATLTGGGFVYQATYLSNSQAGACVVASNGIPAELPALGNHRCQQRRLLPFLLAPQAVKGAGAMTKRIPLTQGKYALVDDEDYEELTRWSWSFHRKRYGGYAQRKVWVDGHKQTIFMHRQIMNTPDGMVTDHINRNGIDNRRSNLRVCTPRQNMANRKKHRDNTSGYRGVSRSRRRWTARIHYKGKDLHLGTFDSAVEAAMAYDEKAVELRGEFAALNFPSPADAGLESRDA